MKISVSRVGQSTIAGVATTHFQHLQPIVSPLYISRPYPKFATLLVYKAPVHRGTELCYQGGEIISGEMIMR